MKNILSVLQKYISVSLMYILYKDQNMEIIEVLNYLVFKRGLNGKRVGNINRIR